MGNPGGHHVRAEEEIIIGSNEEQQKLKMRVKFTVLAVWAPPDGITKGNQMQKTRGQNHERDKGD
jgi:hypothetical protein